MDFDRFHVLLTKLKISASESYSLNEKRQFICELIVNNLKEYGIGTSKKSAKLEAVRLMIPHLVDIAAKKCKYHTTQFSNLQGHPLRLVEYVTNSRRDPSPSYIVTQLIDGTFKCEMHLSLNSEPYIGTGIGSTKIEAKECAAKNFLDDFQILYKTNDC